MHIFNIRVSNIQKQIKPVYNLYKDNLNNILYSNIDNIITKIVYIKPELLKQNALIMQLYTP